MSSILDTTSSKPDENAKTVKQDGLMGLKRIRPAWVTLFAVLAALALLGMNEMGYRSAVRGVQGIEAYERERALQINLMRHMFNVEAAQRGYSLTRDPQYLAVYTATLGDISAELEEMRRVYESDERRLKIFTQLSLSIAEKLTMLDALMKEAVNAKAGAPRGDLDYAAAAVALPYTGDTIRNLIIELSSQSMEAMKNGITQYLASSQRSRWGVAVAVVFSLIAFQMYLWQSIRFAAASRRKRKVLERYSQQLQSMVRARTQRLTELATHLQTVREEEKESLARELHDEMGALMTSAKLDVARLKSKLDKNNVELMTRLEHLTATLNEGISLKRRIIEHLRPSSLSNLGLVAALEIQANEFAERSGLLMRTQFDAVKLPNDRALTIYRVVQESLTNIAKYAEASKIDIVLKDTEKAVEITIKDDGVGFDVPARINASHGLPGMHHRVEAHGGQLDIQSDKGAGTVIRATIPK